jgi:cytochrome c551/c552
MTRRFWAAVVVLALGLVSLQATPQKPAPSAQTTLVAAAHAETIFKTSADCLACHNSLRAPSGEDVSIGSSWRASMMANSSRDPYWQAGVRRETLDHPTASAAIQDECSVCHMPMARTAARANGRDGEIFSHLPVGSGDSPENLLAYDGVSCTLCHQIADEKLGTPESFTGGYVVSGPQTSRGSQKLVEPRPIFGPFKIENPLATIMRSSTAFQPTEASHIRKSELCATCHTLITKALGPNGKVIGELPEQMVYQEWRHSAFLAEEKSCQSCHMPAVAEDTPITSVLGLPRPGFARHQFVGGNAFMLRMLNRYRDDLGVAALPQELEASVARTVVNLQQSTATVSIEQAAIAGGRLNIDVAVRNITGHKLPTAYPSRRAWLHLVVRDRSGKPLFESGAVASSGLIQGNDADADQTRFEPHYTEIRQPDQVQVFESVMKDQAGVPTTGLLTAVGYLKDNRLLPRGFEKSSAEPGIAVVGGAIEDTDFIGGADRIRYSVDLSGGVGPFDIEVELRFQSIGFRWAENLKKYDAPEPKRFVTYYESMSTVSSEVLSRASATAR